MGQLIKFATRVCKPSHSPAAAHQRPLCQKSSPFTNLPPASSPSSESGHPPPPRLALAPSHPPNFSHSLSHSWPNALLASSVSSPPSTSRVQGPDIGSDRHTHHPPRYSHHNTGLFSPTSPPTPHS